MSSPVPFNALYRSTSSGALEKESADARPCCSICADRLTRYRSEVLKATVPCSRANEMYRFCRKETAGFQHILYRTNQFDFLTSLGTFMASNTSATEGAPWPGCAASPACCDVLQRPSNPLCDCKQQCCDHSSSACNDTVLRVTICIVHVSSSQIKCNFHHLRYT